MDDRNNPTLIAMLWWMLSGILLVAAAFIIRSGSGLWAAINAAGIVAAIYLVIVTLYVVRKPLRWGARLWALVIMGFALGAIAFSWYQTQSSTTERAAIQSRQYAEQVRGTAITHMTNLLHRTMEEYYQQSAPIKKSLNQVFFSHNGDLRDGGRRAFMWVRRWDMYLASESPDSLVLIAQTEVKGRSSEFRNGDGKSGFIQEKMVLTAKGITHVSEN